MHSVTISAPQDVATVNIGQGNPLALLAGPCVIESTDLVLEVAGALQRLCARLAMPYIFKASFDKANRTSLTSFRGPGLGKGLAILQQVRELGIPVVTDIHLPEQAAPVAEVVDLLQIPAFLCRQTDLLVAAAATGKPVNIKKGQFLAPGDMRHAVAKLRQSGCDQILLTERGASYGYHNLVVDMRGLGIMRGLGCPVVYDATHSVQLPGGGNGVSAGERRFIAPLSRAAVAAGVDALFMEVHPDPDHALCDGANSLPLHDVEPLLRQLQAIHHLCQTSKPQPT